MGSSETNGRPPSPVRDARRALGLRLADVAAEAEIAISYLSMVENGYVPNPAVRARIASALGAPAGELWPGVGA